MSIIKNEIDDLEESISTLLDQRDKMIRAIRLAQTAMRAPFDDWKGELERKALDAAREILAEVEAPKYWGDKQ